MALPPGDSPRAARRIGAAGLPSSRRVDDDAGLLGLGLLGLLAGGHGGTVLQREPDDVDVPSAGALGGDGHRGRKKPQA